MQVNQRPVIEPFFQPIIKGASEIQQAGSEFATQLKEKVDSQQKGRLQDQQQALMLQAQSLLQHMDIKKLQQYREKISAFFEELTQETYSFQEEKYTDNFGHSRYYATIQTVNRELEDLFELAKKAEKNRMEILSKIDSINGLILNIVI